MLNALRGALGVAFVALALCGMTQPAMAKVHVFRLTGQEVPILLPDSWKVQTIPLGIQMRSPDEEVIMWAEAVNGDTVTVAMDDYEEYFKDNGVKLTGPAKTSQKELNGMAITMIELPATYEGKPSIIQFIVCPPKAGAKKGILIGYWASPTGAVTHGKAVGRIMDDLLRP